MSTGPRILITASGTGGHLFPALFIAQELQRQVPDCVIEFIGSGRPLEEKIIGAAGFPRHVIAVQGVKHRGLAGPLRFLADLPRGWLQVRRIFKNFSPQVVVGVGGYVTVLPVLEAWRQGLPTWIHEAELKPGLANSLLIRVASVISTAFADAQIPTRYDVRCLGQPIRPELAGIRKTVTAGEPRKLLVLGGSQGARSLDEAVPALSGLLLNKNCSIRHQCRPENVAAVGAAYKAAGVPADVLSFITNITEALDWADLVISRAGASTVMEIEAANIPAILVPYPFRTENHQRENAQVLERAGKAKIVDEGHEFISRLGTSLGELLNGQAWREMIERPHECRSLSSAREIAKGIVQLVSS